MTWGDDESVEESKAPDPNLMDTSDGGETTNPHGDTGCGGVAQAVTQSQHGNDDVQDWDTEVLNHTFVHILNKDKVDVSVTNDFTLFVIRNGIDDACLLLAMLEDDFESMEHTSISRCSELHKC